MAVVEAGGVVQATVTMVVEVIAVAVAAYSLYIVNKRCYL